MASPSRTCTVWSLISETLFLVICSQDPNLHLPTSSNIFQPPLSLVCPEASLLEISEACQNLGLEILLPKLDSSEKPVEGPEIHHLLNLLLEGSLAYWFNLHSISLACKHSAVSVGFQSLGLGVMHCFGQAQKPELQRWNPGTLEPALSSLTCWKRAVETWNLSLSKPFRNGISARIFIPLLSIFPGSSMFVHVRTINSVSHLKVMQSSSQICCTHLEARETADSNCDKARLKWHASATQASSHAIDAVLEAKDMLSCKNSMRQCFTF